MAELSPMMKQYVSMKQQYKDYILLYRLGDFYEMFFEDAVIASRELDIVLTKKDCGLSDKAPMCGVPYHSVDGYISRLVSKGYKVTICEQVKNEETNEVTGRQVVRTVTPGTVTVPEMLDESKNNYILGATCEDSSVCLCFVDISTGEIYIDDLFRSTDIGILNELTKYSPKEIYLNKECEDISFFKDFAASNSCLITKASDCSEYIGIIEKHFSKSLSELGFGGDGISAKTFGSLLDYLYKTQLCSLSHINKLIFMGRDSYMEIDNSTWRNLEIVETMRSKEKKGSLLWVLDKTKTSMGARLMRRYLEKPLTSVIEIMRRQNAVAYLYDKTQIRDDLRNMLGGICDIDRLATKLVYGTINPRDIKGLAESFKCFPEISRCLSASADEAYLRELSTKFDDLHDLTELVDAAISDTPPIAMKDGGIFRDGYDAEIDELRRMLKNSESILSELEVREKEETGIKNLRVGYNKVFGYYIEVSNSNKDSVPERYIRKQTLVNGERFITPELKEVENKLLHAGDNLVKREYEQFVAIRDTVAKSLDRIKNSAAVVAVIDVLSNLAEVAVKNSYCQPFITDKPVIDIKDGRHPVVEKMLKDDMFIPNSAYMNTTDSRMSIITGPNMAGKSTYMRSVALIALMAQTGSFVPAASATVGITDKLFTRVGASDDLASGQSTFLVEMSEVAYILNNATKRSLIIFDEIGRGTSTFDGMSIARAVLEYVAEKITARSLFATHYHKLTALESSVKGVKNYNVAAKKRGNSITFLRKIVEGGTDDSYGIDVARLAGVKDAVVKRAEEILQTLESPVGMAPLPRKQKEDDGQFSLASGLCDEIIDELKQLDATVLTPIEAMNELYKLTKKAKEIQ